MKEAAGRIKEENDKLFTEQEGLYRQKVTQEGSNTRTCARKRSSGSMMRGIRPRSPPETRPSRIINSRCGQATFRQREVHKELKSDQEAAKATAQRLEDYQMARDAMNNGVFVGAGSGTRLDTAKFAAWLTNNKALSERAGSTEMLKAKLLSTVNGLVKDIKPISNIDIMLGKQQAGDINMEPSAINALLNQTLQHSYRDLADYDSKAHSLVNGLSPALEARYKSPECILDPASPCKSADLARQRQQSGGTGWISMPATGLERQPLRSIDRSCGRPRCLDGHVRRQSGSSGR